MADTSVTKKPESSAVVSIDMNANPINIINGALDQAHATIDLLWSITCDDSAESILENLSVDTLSNALHSAMTSIERAKAAANREVAHA